MTKQYLLLTIESDTFKGMKADFNELLQQLLEKLFAGKIAEGSITMKLAVSLSETFSNELNKTIAVPLFKHKVTANYTEKLENAGAVSLPNTYLEYDEDLQAFVLKPCYGEQDIFADQKFSGLQLRDPMCNDCGNRDTSACEHCESCDKWEPMAL